MEDPYSNFIFAINSTFTRQQYEISLKRFFKDIGLDGTIQEQCSEFVEKSDQIKDIVSFLQKQRDRVNNKEITGSTIRNYVKSIKLFCDMNNIDIIWKKLIRGLPRGRKWADDRAPTLEEIRKIVEYPDRRVKPIFYTKVSSGIRLGAWDYLKWGHITKLDGAAKMRVYAGEEEEYFTFITSEAYNALEEWMEFRKKSGENVTKDSWLMIQLWDTKGLNLNPKKLGLEGVKSLIETAIRVSGVRTKIPGKKRYEFPTNHGFRKFFKTHAEQVMKPINVEMLMGHSVGLSRSYYKPRESELLEDYLKAVPLLTINEVNKVMQEKDAAFKGIEANLQKKDREIEELRHNDKMKEDALATLSDQVMRLMVEVQELKKQE
jgi:integrase